MWIIRTILLYPKPITDQLSVYMVLCDDRKLLARWEDLKTKSNIKSDKPWNHLLQYNQLIKEIKTVHEENVELTRKLKKEIESKKCFC